MVGVPNTVQDIGKLISAWCSGSGATRLLDSAGRCCPEKTMLDDQYTVSHSGNGLDVDKGQGKYGWYFIRCSRDNAFSLRWCKQVGPKVLSFEAGWLLDVYVKDAQYAKQAPLAPALRATVRSLGLLPEPGTAHSIKERLCIIR